MESYKRGSHTVWDCKYHVVWVTKYRYPVLGGDVGQRCRELLRETARAPEMVVHAGSINREYVSVHSTQSVGVACGAIPEEATHKVRNVEAHVLPFLPPPIISLAILECLLD